MSEDTHGANQVLLGEFKIQEDVKMYTQLPDYGDFGGFYLARETDMAVISKRAYGRFAKPPRPTLKHRLFNAFDSEEIESPLRSLCARGKKGRI